MTEKERLPFGLDTVHREAMKRLIREVLEEMPTPYGKAPPKERWHRPWMGRKIEIQEIPGGYCAKVRDAVATTLGERPFRWQTDGGLTEAQTTMLTDALERHLNERSKVDSGESLLTESLQKDAYTRRDELLIFRPSTEILHRKTHPDLHLVEIRWEEHGHSWVVNKVGESYVEALLYALNAVRDFDYNAEPEDEEEGDIIDRAAHRTGELRARLQEIEAAEDAEGPDHGEADDTYEAHREGFASGEPVQMPTESEVEKAGEWLRNVSNQTPSAEALKESARRLRQGTYDRELNGEDKTSPAKAHGAQYQQELVSPKPEEDEEYRPFLVGRKLEGS